MLAHVLAITFALIVLYLVLSHAGAFGQATGSLGSLYTNSIKTLQGRS